MGWREVTVKETVADGIAARAWYIESKGLIATAENFADDVYDFFIKLSDSRRRHAYAANRKELFLATSVFRTKRNIGLYFWKRRRN
jgi:hypothetical protein